MVEFFKAGELLREGLLPKVLTLQIYPEFHVKRFLICIKKNIKFFPFSPTLAHIITKHSFVKTAKEYDRRREGEERLLNKATHIMCFIGLFY